MWPRFHLLRRYARGVARMRASDVLVASFPRSGSTRLRLILAGLLTRDSSVRLSHEAFEQTVPELGGAGPWRRDEAWPLFIKTHRPYALPLARPRAILLLRHPLDALASFHAYRTALIGAPSMSPSAFLRDPRHGLPRWIRHTCSWRGRVEHILRFKALMAEPADEIQALMQTLGTTVPQEILDSAIANATSDAARRLRSTRRGGDQFESSFQFARTDSDSPRATFDPDDEAWAGRQLDAAGLVPLVRTL
ncbi:MAG: sulfotransferase domain-containing protein [Bacteroidota bacterium]